jgi:hypothetical protein
MRRATGFHSKVAYVANSHDNRHDLLFPLSGFWKAPPILCCCWRTNFRLRSLAMVNDLLSRPPLRIKAPPSLEGRILKSEQPVCPDFSTDHALIASWKHPPVYRAGLEMRVAQTVG